MESSGSSRQRQRPALQCCEGLNARCEPCAEVLGFLDQADGPAAAHHELGPLEDTLWKGELKLRMLFWRSLSG